MAKTLKNAEMRYRFRDSILVKGSGDQLAMVLTTEANDMYQFEGDVARMIVMIQKASVNKKPGLTRAQIETRLKKTAKNTRSLELGVEDALKFLTQMQLLEARGPNPR
jgi:hypothetical protein